MNPFSQIISTWDHILRESLKAQLQVTLKINKSFYGGKQAYREAKGTNAPIDVAAHCVNMDTLANIRSVIGQEVRAINLARAFLNNKEYVAVEQSVRESNVLKQGQPAYDRLVTLFGLIGSSEEALKAWLPAIEDKTETESKEVVNA